MEKTILYCYPFIKDIVENKTYYCSTEAIMVVSDIPQCYINPYGRASMTFNDEESLTFPIKKVGNEILLLESKIALTQYHSSEVDEEKSWIEIDMKKISIKVIHSEDDLDVGSISYDHMGLLELETSLSNWFDVVIDKNTLSFDTHEDITEIIKLLKQNIRGNKNKEELLDLFSNLKVTLDDLENEAAISIVKDLSKICRQRLLKLGKSKSPSKKDFSTLSTEDLEAIVKSIKSSDEDIKAAEQELRNRAQKK